MRNHSAGLALTVVLLSLSTLSAEAGNGKIINDTSLHAGPQANYRAVGEMTSGSVLVIYGCDAKFDWCDVGQAQRRGWVSADDLAVIRGANFVPVRDLAPFVGVRVVSYDEQDYHERHYGGATLAAVPKHDAGPDIEVQAPANATIAEQPAGEGGPAATSAAYNNAMTLVARALQTPQVNEQQPAVDAAPTEQAEAPAAKARNTWPGEALSDSSIRSGPASKYPRIATISSGREIAIHGCTARYRWCDISAGDKRGWVYAPLLAASTNGNLGPLVKVARKAGIPIIKFDMKSYHARHYAGNAWQNSVGGPDVIQLKASNARTASASVAKVKSQGAVKAAARVIRIPGPTGSSLPPSANALQATDEAQGESENTVELAQPSGFRRFIPKFLQ